MGTPFPSPPPRLPFAFDPPLLVVVAVFAAFVVAIRSLFYTLSGQGVGNVLRESRTTPKHEQTRLAGWARASNGGLRAEGHRRVTYQTPLTESRPPGSALAESL